MPEARVDKSRGGQQPRGVPDPRAVLVETVHMPHDLTEVESANECSSEASRQEGSGGNSMSYLWKMQLKREERSQAEACEKYCKVEWDSLLFWIITALDFSSVMDSGSFHTERRRQW